MTNSASAIHEKGASAVASEDVRVASTDDAIGAPIAFPSAPRSPSSRIRLIGAGAIATSVLVAALSLLPTPSRRDAIDKPPITAAGTGAPGAVAGHSNLYPSFTETALDGGWTRYGSAFEGFSLELPRGWGPIGAGEFGPELRFSASEAPPFATFGASLYVMKSAVNASTDPEAYFGLWRDYLSDLKGVEGVGMTPTTMRDGSAFVLTSEHRSKTGEHTETTYGVLHGSSAYRLVFVVSDRYLSEYDQTFHDIAMTFDIVD